MCPWKNLLPVKIYERLERADLTPSQIITYSDSDIKRLTNMKSDDITTLKKVVSDFLSPSIVSGDGLMKKETECQRLKTGCGLIDKILKGGFQRGKVVELYGESGSGKTQLALQTTLTNWAQGVVYICTEDVFPLKRLEDMKLGLPLFKKDVEYGRKIYVEHACEASELMACIKVRLPKLLQKNLVSLVIVDSVAAPFRCETTNYIQRAEELREMAMALTKVAQDFGLAVLCINQVTACFETIDNVLPSLGLAWSNMISSRFHLRKTSAVIELDWGKCFVREFRVVFAPDIANLQATFIITQTGIQELPQSL